MGVGVAALLSWLGTGSIGYGLVVPWARLAGIAALGILAALIAAIVPAIEATRVSPLEALASVGATASSGRRRAVHVAAVVVMLVAGAGAVAAGLREGGSWPAEVPLVVVAGGAVLAVTGVLAATPLTIGPVLRVVARLARRRPVVALAASAAARNPIRSGTTTAMLILAFGLIVTVQVGAATGTAGAIARLDERYPADVSLQAAIQEPEPIDMAFGSSPISNRDANGMLVGFSSDALDLARSTPGVADAGLFVTSEPVTIIAGLQLTVVFPVMALDPGVQPLLHHPVRLTDGEVGLPSAMMRDLSVSAGAVVQLRPLVGDEVALRVVEVNIGSTLAVVTPATMTRLAVHTKPGLILARFSGSRPPAEVLDTLSARLIPENSGLSVSGSVQQQENLHRLVDGAARILTGLLAVVMVVAMVGVANTLGLSVVERTRESALLRALGLTRGALRAMLLAEALVLGAIAVCAGLALGVAVGWAGAAAVLRAAGAAVSGPVVPWPSIAVAAAAVMVAASAASVLPGRTAARATPVAALADLG